MVAESLMIGAIGGFIANFGAQWAWRSVQKPNLMYTEKAPTEFVTDEDYKKIEYRIQVKNHGKSAAKNCRAALYMTGVRENTKYKIKTNPHWIESTKPSTTTINPGDTVSFPAYRFYLTDKTSNQNSLSFRPHYRFPSQDGWQDGVEMVEKYHLEDGEVQNMSFAEDITKPIFEEICWHKQQVAVTSENTDKITGEFKEVSKEIMEGLGGKEIRVEGDVLMTSQNVI